MRLPSTDTIPWEMTKLVAPLAKSPPQAMDSSDLMALQEVIQHTFPSPRVDVQEVQELPRHFFQIRLLYLSNGSRVVLKASPPTTIPLLKIERHGLDAESFSLLVLAKSGLPIPVVLRHESNVKVLGSPFLLVSYLHGTPLADLLPSLSRSDRLAIDRQISSFESTVAQHMSATFGPVSLVARGHGYQSWREAFKSMLGSVLKDGEDTFVNLPYSQIRQQVAMSEYVLDEIKEARLVVPGFGNADNVLVNERTKIVTGLLDFKGAIWGDTDLVTGLATTSMRGLL